ncbi:MAG TPA: phage/plasmid primase, P4 family [Chthoniobacterales bacterium]|nr:phage/plasmid primase, P4 family [Chthoniobacterales bacterium]
MTENVFATTSFTKFDPSLANDINNANLFVQLHGGEFIFDPLNREWLYLKDGFWAADPGDLKVLYAAENVSSYLMKHAHDDRTDDAATKRKKYNHGVVSGDNPRVNAIVRFARNRLWIDPARLNHDPYILGCANGVVDLKYFLPNGKPNPKFGKLRPAEPIDLVTRNTQIQFDPKAHCETWDKFLLEIMSGKHHMVDYLWRVFGYSLTGDISERAFFIFHGDGRNGKSTLVEVVKAALGLRRCGYSQKARFSTFLVKDSGAGIGDDIAHLSGARLVIASETAGNRELDTSLVKELTGGDTIRTRHLYASEFEFQPQFKLILVTNTVPPIHEVTEAIWDRLHYVAFNYRVPEEKVDRKLREKLQAELPGILAKMVLACGEWQRDGLKPPPEVFAARTELYRDNDSFGAFLDEEVEMAQASYSVHREIYQRLRLWWGRNFSSKPPSSKRLLQYLRHMSKSKKLPIEECGTYANSPKWVGLGLKRMPGESSFFEPREPGEDEPEGREN